MSSLKRVLISVTHLASGSLPLMGLLNTNPRVQFIQTNPIINNYPDLKATLNMPHKMNSVAAMFALDINYNYQLSSSVYLPHAHYLFVIRPPDQVLNVLTSNGLYGHDQAANYYCFRLRRMCEIAKRVKHGMLLTYEEIIRGDHVEHLTDFLTLRESVLHSSENFDHLTMSKNTFKKETLEWCRDCYERHLFFLKRLPLNRL